MAEHGELNKPLVSGYIPQLDGLRALAILLVLVHHFVTPWSWFGGAIGVDVFFVLSGFLITGILLRERESFGTIRLKRFYARRLIRLYPPLIAAVLVLALPAIIATRESMKYLVSSFSALTYMTPVLVEFQSGATLFWRHTWSLGIEEVFYLLWPAMVLLVAVMGGRLRALQIFALVTSLALVGCGIAVNLAGEHASYLLRSAGLFVGCALAIAVHRGLVQARRWMAPLGLFLLAAAVGTAAHAEFIGVAMTQLGTAVLIPALLGRPTSWLGRVTGSRPAVFVGKASYELYLWHYPVMIIAVTASGEPPISTAWWSVPVSVVLAISAYLLLSPVLAKWKERLPY